MFDILARRLAKNTAADLQNPKDPALRAAYGKVAGAVGIACNAVLCVAKLLVGAISGSVAITADAVNNLSDASSSIITLLGFKLAERPADAEHPYGHARMEYLSGLAVSVMILAIGLQLAKSGIEKIISPEPVEFNAVMALVLLGSIAVKLWMAFFNRSIGKKIGSATLEATSADSRNDVITTSAVLAAAVLAQLTKLNLDGWMGLAVAVFILYSGIGIVKTTLDPLLGAAPDPEFLEEVTQTILSYEGVLGTHDLMLHDYGPGRRFGSVHVEMDAAADPLLCHNVIDTIERDFFKTKQLHLVVHYDPIVTDDVQTAQNRAIVQNVLESLSPKLSMHDFRMVAGPAHTNLIFDVVAPFDLEFSDAELCQKIEALVKAQAETLYTVVTVDRG